MASRDFYIAAGYARGIIEQMRRWGIEPRDFLSGMEDDGLRELDRPGARLSVATYKTLIERARSMTGNPAVGFHFGLTARLSSHGGLGFAAMTAPTLRDTVEVAVRYLPTRTNAFEFRFVETKSEGALIVEELCDLGESRETIVGAVIVALARFVNAASYPAKIQGSLDFAFKRPDYAARLLPSRLQDVAIRFDQPHHALRCDAAALSLRLHNADPEALAMARGHCEVEMMALGIGDEIVPKVRTVVSHPQGGYRPLEDVARQLGLSARTLKRRLASEGTSFSVIVDERRAEAARLMVMTDSASLDEIAAQLGYSHTSAFSKAFRRWTGLTPKEFRNKSSKSR